MDELLKDFLTETSDQLEAVGAQLVRFERDPTDARILANIFRLVHAIKAACGFLDLRRLEKIALSAETLIDRLADRAAPKTDAVPLMLEALDRIKFISSALAEGRGEPPGDDEALIARIETGAKGRRAGSVSSVVPAVRVWEAGAGSEIPPERRAESARFSLASLDNLCALIGKLAVIRNQLAAAANATDSDGLHAPLGRLSTVAADMRSLVRTARTLPVESLFAGLPGLVRDLAARRGGALDLTLRGGETRIDRSLVQALRDPLARLIRDAVEHGIESAEERRRLGKPEAGALGVSARLEGAVLRLEVADDGRELDFGATGDLADRPGSGRGAVLREVRANLGPIDGSASLENRAGAGVAAVLRIPVATALVSALILVAAGERYALPTALVEGVLAIGADNVLVEVKGNLALVAADGVFPAGELWKLTKSPPRSLSTGHAPRLALKMRAGALVFVLVVDELLESPEISVQPLPVRPRENAMFSGAAVLDDGSVVLVLDPEGLASALPAKPASAREPPASEASPRPTSLVVFRSEGPALRALPVSAVARIVRIPPGAAGVIDVGDQQIPLIGVDGQSVAHPRAPDSMALLLGERDDRAGLIVDEIVDIVEAEPREERFEILDLAPLFARQRDIRRSAGANSNGAAVLILEPAAFFRDMIASTLTRHGYRPFAVGDISAASAAAETGDFAAILVDVEMAVASDGGIGRLLRDTADGLPPALIGLSSHGGPTMRARAGAAGLASVVGKFDRGRLLAALRSALSPTELAA